MENDNLKPVVQGRRDIEMYDPNYEIIKSSTDGLLGQIRPSWQSKNLIERTRRLLPIDPSSACQRIFNASVHDLREKVVTAGLDIAIATANLYSDLPKISNEEEIYETYDTSKLINLTYRMGLLSRPEYRRIMRVYDIRKDLEHEDDEYEAGIEDVLYVFSSCVNIILANDPVHIIKISDIINEIEQPENIVLEKAVVEDYKSAPTPRQLEIYQMLISNALNNEKADIVRQNSYNSIAILREFTDRKVIIQASEHFNDKRLNRRRMTAKEARVANISGLMPYLRIAYKESFFESFYEKMKQTSFHWTSHEKHGNLLRDLLEVGGLTHITKELLPSYIEWLILCYIGEAGGYGAGRNRRVFFSNIGAPLSYDILSYYEGISQELISHVEASSREIKGNTIDMYVKRRMDDIYDITD